MGKIPSGGRFPKLPGFSKRKAAGTTGSPRKNASKKLSAMLGLSKRMSARNIENLPASDKRLTASRLPADFEGKQAETPELGAHRTPSIVEVIAESPPDPKKHQRQQSMDRARNLGDLAWKEKWSEKTRLKDRLLLQTMAPEPGGLLNALLVFESQIAAHKVIENDFWLEPFGFGATGEASGAGVKDALMQMCEGDTRRFAPDEKQYLEKDMLPRLQLHLKDPGYMIPFGSFFDRFAKNSTGKRSISDLHDKADLATCLHQTFGPEVGDDEICEQLGKMPLTPETYDEAGERIKTLFEQKILSSIEKKYGKEAASSARNEMCEAPLSASAMRALSKKAFFPTLEQKYGKQISTFCRYLESGDNFGSDQLTTTAANADRMLNVFEGELTKKFGDSIARIVMGEIRAATYAEPELEDFIGDPGIDAQKKQDLVDEVVQTKAHGQTFNLVNNPWKAKWTLRAKRIGAELDGRKRIVANFGARPRKI